MKKPHLLHERGSVVYVAYAYEVREVRVESIILWRDRDPSYCVQPVDGKDMLLKDFSEPDVFDTPEEAKVRRDEHIAIMRRSMAR